MTTHTPGPWRAAKVRDYAGWTDVTTEAVLEEFGAETREGMVARVWTPEDARLIAAAPELLSTLEAIAKADPREWDEEFRGQFREWAQSLARAATLKATRGAP